MTSYCAHRLTVLISSACASSFSYSNLLIYLLCVVDYKSSFTGIVFEVFAEAGQTYPAETALFKVGDRKALEAVANITEEDYPIVSVWQAVEMLFDALPVVTVQVNVDRIIPRRSDRYSLRHISNISL